MLPFQEDNQDLNSTSIRQLIAVSLNKELQDLRDMYSNGALSHVLARDNHDNDLKDILIRLDDFIKSLQKEEDACSLVILEALELAMFELVKRLFEDGLQSNFFDEIKN